MTAAEITKWLEARKLNELHIAASTGLNPVTVKNFLAGETKNPHPGTRIAIEKFIEDWGQQQRPERKTAG